MIHGIMSPVSPRMVKRVVQQGRSEKGAEAYSMRYVEGSRDASTMLGERCVSAHPGWEGEKSTGFTIRERDRDQSAQRRRHPARHHRKRAGARDRRDHLLRIGVR